MERSTQIHFSSTHPVPVHHDQQNNHGMTRGMWVSIAFGLFFLSCNMAGWRIGCGESNPLIIEGLGRIRGNGYLHLALVENENRIHQTLRQMRRVLGEMEKGLSGQ